MNTILEIKNLDVYYEDICALYDINLVVKERDFIGILGPNGGGKSTLFKAILGMVKASNGIIELYGENICKSNRIIGYVPQFTAFEKDFPIKVIDVILMGKLSGKNSLFHRYSQEDKNEVNMIMERLEISKLKEKQISHLSGGQMQRVLIARALTVKPSLLLMDEPTTSVDNYSKEIIYSLLKKLNKDITIILATHDMSVISSYVKSIGCLNRELHYHREDEFMVDEIEKMYGCPVEIFSKTLSKRIKGRYKEK